MNNKEIVSGLINKEGKIFEFEKLEECPVDESRCREIADEVVNGHAHSSISLYDGADLLGEVSIENTKSAGAVLKITLQPGSIPIVGDTAHALTLSIGASHLLKLANALDPDLTSVENSQKLITSGAVYAELALLKERIQALENGLLE